MNLDTDLQWAFWEGVLGYYKKNEALSCKLNWVIQRAQISQIKNIMTLRVWLRKGEESFIKRLEQSFDDLNCINRNA
jgi:fructose-bisphosphate aldolase, class II